MFSQSFAAILEAQPERHAIAPNVTSNVFKEPPHLVISLIPNKPTSLASNLSEDDSLRRAP